MVGRYPDLCRSGQRLAMLRPIAMAQIRRWMKRNGVSKPDLLIAAVFTSFVTLRGPALATLNRRA